ncbi:MAG: hypothetical protein ACLU18_16130 [Bacteroides thetaiotaomicron]
MSRTILFIAAFWLAVPLWGQSGIMPRRSSSIKIPSQETMREITEADPGVGKSGTGIDIIRYDISGVAVFSGSCRYVRVR